MFEKVAILGPGLLGSSLARAVRSLGLAECIHIWARRPESRVQAEAADWCDAVFASPEDAVGEADLVVACAPVEHILPLLKRASFGLKAGALVTDVGSTKSLICRQAASALPQGTTFIGSHPMAGSEKTGMEHGRAELFQAAACMVTPLADTPEEPLDRLVGFWKTLGMEVTIVSPEQHDEIVASISHLPHLLASALAAHLGQEGKQWSHLVGNGLRDTTRVAAGDPALWREIVGQNREELLRSLKSFEQTLHRFRVAIANGEDGQLLHLLRLGKAFRDQLPDTATKA